MRRNTSLKVSGLLCVHSSLSAATAGQQELGFFYEVLDPSLFGVNGKELSSMEPGLTVDWEDGRMAFSLL